MSHLHCNCATLVYTHAPHPHDMQSLQQTFQKTAAVDAGSSSQQTANPAPTPSRSGSVASSFGNFFSAAASMAHQIKSSVDKKMLASRLEQDKEQFMEQFYSHTTNGGGQFCCGARCSIVSAGTLHSGWLFLSVQAVCFIQSDGKSSTHADPVPAVDQTVSTGRSCSGGEDSSHRTTSGNNNKIKEIIPLDDIVSILPSVSLPVEKRTPPVVIGVPSSSVVPNAMQLYTRRPLCQIFQFIFTENDDFVTFQAHPKMLPEHVVSSLTSVKTSAAKVCCAVNNLWLARKLISSSAVGGNQVPLASPSSERAVTPEDSGAACSLFAPVHF